MWTAAVSGANSNDYEVNTTLAINSTYYGLGGTYMHFLRANSTSVTPHKTGGKRIGTGRTRIYLGGDGS
jgi:hypothetical protein